MSSTDPVELEVWVHVDEDISMLVSLPDRDAEKVWLPKSQVTVTFARKQHKHTAYSAEIAIPEWLAVDRGLI